MNPKNLPYYMFSRPALTGYVEPAQGRGFLRFYADVSDPIGEGAIHFTLTAWQWHNTGLQPFAWELMPPVGERKYPVIRLIVARSVELQMTVLNGLNPGAAKNLGFVLGPRSPFVAVFRPQDDSLIPQPGEPIEPSRFLGEPFLAGPGAPGPVQRVLDSFMTVNVTPKPLGVEIRNIFDGYRIDFGIDPGKEGQPAAYAYELITPVEDPKLGGVLLRIVHTDNVYIKATAHEDFEQNIRVQSAGMSSTDHVPPQGSSLASFTFRPVDIEVKRSPRHQGLIFIFEAAISFVPYIGPLYNISQFAYASCTGQDFWGREQTTSGFLTLGIAALLPFALKSTPAVTTLRTELKGSPLAHALDDAVTTEVRHVAERELLEAVGQIDAKSAAELGRLLTLFASGKLGATQVVERFKEAVGNAYLRALDRRSIEMLMTADFRTFKNPQLAAGFNRFAAGLGKKGSGRVADPIAWALSNTNPKSRFARELERELGTRWRDTLKASRNDARLKPLSSTELAHYDSLAGRVEDYMTMAKLNKGHGGLFEADHILEQRFWRNDPRVASAFDEKGEGMAMLVPKTPAVASLMPGKTIAYVHNTKTKMLSDLIPNGREAEFTVQQVWDAHVFVLESLNVHRSVTFGDRLLDSFKMLARARGEKLTFRLPTGQMFSPAEKRPMLVGSAS